MRDSGLQIGQPVRLRVLARDVSITLEEALACVGLGVLLKRVPGPLPGGQRQRGVLGRARATQPKLLILDEPLASLDAARKHDILPWLEKLRDELKIPMI